MKPVPGGRSLLFAMLQQVPRLASEVIAEFVDDLQIDPFRRFLVKARQGPAVDSRVPGHVRNFDLPFAHQAGQVAFDHVDRSM